MSISRVFLRPFRLAGAKKKQQQQDQRKSGIKQGRHHIEK